MTRIQRRPVLVAGAAASLLVATAAWSQATYPSKPIKMVVPHAPGAITDTLARLIGVPLSKALGQPIVMENRPGGNTAIAAQAVASAQGDGYTLLMATAAIAANAAGVIKSTGYDAIKDFTPISHIGSVVLVVLANPALPVKTVKDLVEYARRNPGALKYASGNLAGIVHMGMLTRAEKLDMLHVPYKSTPPAITDLLAGHVNVMVSDLSSALPLIRTGKLTALGVIGTRRSATAPDIATVREQGMTDIREFPGWLGIYGPANMPMGVVQVLNREINAALRTPEVLERAASLGLDLQGSTPEGLAIYTREQIAVWKVIVRDFNIQPQN